MERKVYKTVIAIIFFVIMTQQNFAQTMPSPKKTDTTSQKDYQQQMKNLQQSMRDLQKQMMGLQQQHTKEILKKNADNLKELRFMNFDTVHNFVRLDNNFIRLDSLRSFGRALSSNIYGFIQPDMLNGGSVYIERGARKGNQQENLIEKTKTFSKSYPVSPKDKLIIDNQYGKVTVNTWNKKEFKVDVEIRVGTADEAESQKLLDGVDIVSTQNQAGISFKTNIPERSNNSNLFSTRRTNGNRTISVNYTVFMPIKNALDISNRFGAVILPDLEGPVTIRSSYGNFTAKELSNVANNLHLQFGNANIGQLNGGDLKFEYGNLKIGTANNLNATMGFSPVNIERLKSSANIKVQYGSGLKIDNLDKNLKNLDIDASFTNVSLDLNGSENFLFDVTVKRNQFNYNNMVKIFNQPKSGNEGEFNVSKNYKGYVGKSGSGNKVTIKSNYKLVSFN